MLELKNLSFKDIIRRFNLTIEKGEVVALLGRNGAGKSTLLRMIAGLLQATGGTICWEGADLHTVSRKRWSQLITLVPQGATPPFNYSVSSFIAMGRYSLDRKRGEQILPYLRETHLLHLKDASVLEISQGERQRAYFARGMATEAALYLLDEPTAHLDRENQKMVWDLIKALRVRGKSVLIATHDWERAHEYASRHIEIYRNNFKAKS